MLERLFTVSCLLGVLLIPASLYAGLYYWTDENGIKHFSTNAPAGDVDVIEVIPEVEYDEAADEARMEDYREWRRNQREQFLEEVRQAEAEEKARLAAQKRREEERRRKREAAARLAREKAEAEKERQERLYDDDKDDDTIRVNPAQPLGISDRNDDDSDRVSPAQPLGIQ